MDKSFEVKSDCLDIVNRIKAIDENYFIVFDLNLNKFQLHNFSQGKNTYCLTFPFEVLDERAIGHVLKTRVQNFDEMIKVMDAENEKLNKAKVKQILNDFKENFYDS